MQILYTLLSTELIDNLKKLTDIYIFNANSTNESKQIIKKYEELRSKIRDLISSITKNSDSYYEKCMKIKFNSHDKLPLNKTMEIHNMARVVRAVFIKKINIIPNNQYYS